MIKNNRFMQAQSQMSQLCCSCIQPFQLCSLYIVQRYTSYSLCRASWICSWARQRYASGPRSSVLHTRALTHASAVAWRVLHGGVVCSFGIVPIVMVHILPSRFPCNQICQRPDVSAQGVRVVALLVLWVHVCCPSCCPTLLRV